MGENVQDYVMAYSFTKLEETARTFRRLGEAYDNVADANLGQPGISKQLFLVADVLEECMTMHLQTEEIDRECVRDFSRRCFMCGIRVRNVKCIRKNRGKKELVMQARTVGRNCISAKKLLAPIRAAFGCGYYTQDSNRLIINEEYHQYIFAQEDHFRILSGVARRQKDSSRFNGDNFMISHLDCGKTIVALADGMGSGRRAFIESRMVIELMENCIDAGFEERAALDLINAAYMAGQQGQRTEDGQACTHPVTMDMSVIDCQSGMLHCIKLGAAATFIKRDTCVEIIKSTTLPLGVLEKVDYDCATKKLYDGDYVVMISDGILDNLPGIHKEEQMAEIINNIDIKNPDAMAEEIMSSSLSCNHMKPSDDMTVMVLGLFDTYDK